MRKGFMLIMLLVVLSANDQIPGAPQDHPILIRGAVIHPVSSDAFSGDILFDDGKNTGLGENIRIAVGAEEIDGSGLHVYPGLISSATTMGLVEIGAVRATLDTDETGRVNPVI